jgi:hypothetical protein
MYSPMMAIRLPETCSCLCLEEYMLCLTDYVLIFILVSERKRGWITVRLSGYLPPQSDASRLFGCMRRPIHMEEGVIWRIMNKLLTADKGWSFSLGVGRDADYFSRCITSVICASYLGVFLGTTWREDWNDTWNLECKECVYVKFIEDSCNRISDV